ncbi:hypothetical protein N434_04804 [Rhizobium sp. UGM030330-04]|nr:hypothetical protein N434_04804 [Rhizobium sp. UGM030330-04]
MAGAFGDKSPSAERREIEHTVGGLVSTGGTVATSDDDLKRLYQKLRNKVERGETKKFCSFALLLGIDRTSAGYERVSSKPVGRWTFAATVPQRGPLHSGGFPAARSVFRRLRVRVSSRRGPTALPFRHIHVPLMPLAEGRPDRSRHPLVLPPRLPEVHQPSDAQQAVRTATP